MPLRLVGKTECWITVGGFIGLLGFFSLLQFIVFHEVEAKLKFTETLLKGTAFVLSRSEFPNDLD